MVDGGERKVERGEELKEAEELRDGEDVPVF